MRIIITIIFVVTLAIDLVAWLSYGVEFTISRVMVSWCQQQPFIPFVAGIICGHVFWPQVHVERCPVCDAWEGCEE